MDPVLIILACACDPDAAILSTSDGQVQVVMQGQAGDGCSAR